MIYGSLFAIFGPISGPFGYAVVALIALLLFGNRLPGMMRSLGRSVVEFKKGVAGVEEEIDEAVRAADDKVKADKKEAEV